MQIDDPKVDALVTLVEEATRSSDEGVKFFVEPAKGTLARCVTKRHHLIFGRRGSGKTSLLRKAASDLTLSRRPIAFVDLEEFKGHSYPDVLISILLKAFRKFKDWVDTAAVYPANKTSWWKKFFGASPKTPALSRSQCAALSKELEVHIKNLEALLASPEQSETATTISNSGSDKSAVKVDAGLQGGPAKLATTGTLEAENSSQASTDRKFVESKFDTLARNIMAYKDAFEKISKISDGPGFLMLDDLYHIRTSDQPKVVDYFHRVAKSTSIWLKIGTVKHRSRWYINTSPPMLDLSQYVGARKQRNLALLEFWRSDRVDELRKSGLIFLERS